MRAIVMVTIGLLAGVFTDRAPAVCVGDCNGNETVTIAEAPSCARIRMGERDLSTCPNCDGDGDLMVDACEVAEASRNATQGCREYVPCPPTATATETPTGGIPSATPTATPTATPPQVSSATATPPPASTATATVTAVRADCAGDCDGSGRVTVDELVLGSSIALATAATADCPAFDVDTNDRVSIDELILGVSLALDGCP